MCKEHTAGTILNFAHHLPVQGVWQGLLSISLLFIDKGWLDCILYK